MWTVLLAAAPLVAAPARAQTAPRRGEGPDARVQAMIARAHGAYAAIPRAPPGCGDGGAAPAGEIVVCARARAPDQRVPSTAQSDPNSRAARHELNAGAPHIDLTPHYPGIVVARGCFVPLCPKPPVYYIDVTKLPAPPPGSAADRIASGERRGD